MLKIKTWSFYSYFTIKYIYPTITPSLSLYISLSLSLSHSLSHRSWLSIFLLFSRQPNRIQLLPLSCSISRSLTLSLSLSHKSWRLIFLFSRQPNKFLTQFFYYPPSDQVFILFLTTSPVFFFFPRNLIQVDFDHFNHLLDMNVSFTFEFKFLFDCLLL